MPAAGPAPELQRVHVVDFSALPALPAADEAYCCLGTTIKAAGSQAAFRAVDFDAVLAFARAARQAGVTRFAVVSALGASPRSATFYNRVKGEMEAALAGLGFASLVIVRPSLLAGDRAALGQPLRTGRAAGAARSPAPLAALIPKAWRPISAATVARAMRRALAEARPGVRIVESAELQELGTMKIHFLGAADGVTGSRHLVDTGDRADPAGLRPVPGLEAAPRTQLGSRPAALREVDAVVLSHAHLDHSGWLPALVKHGFRGPIYASPATCELAEVLLLDSAHLQEEDARRANRYGYSRHAKALPLYTRADASARSASSCRCRRGVS